MPLKLPFTKTRHYNVVSRSVLVVCVELLDSSTLECTLSADCTGHRCLQNVAQRIGLSQPEYFGLRYMSKRPYPKVRWVELDRALKKQLDKYAQSPDLTLSVLYYIHDVGLLQDETTRSHFFLQVKQDVLEGKLRCNIDQAVQLAAYSMQAEFGDYHPYRHTVDYLRDFMVLPKLPSLKEQDLGNLLERAVCRYSLLQGLSQGNAETYYILEAQRLPGYGQETFIARDERNLEVYLGASLVGLTITPASGHPVTTLRWNDITNLVNLKRSFVIECPKNERTFQFRFDEPDAAKYIWKMCVKQHTFFRRNEDMLETSAAIGGFVSNRSAPRDETDAPGSIGGTISMRSLTIPDLQRSVMNASALSVQQQFLDTEMLSTYQRAVVHVDPQQYQCSRAFMPDGASYAAAACAAEYPTSAARLGLASSANSVLMQSPEAAKVPVNSASITRAFSVQYPRQSIMSENSTLDGAGLQMHRLDGTRMQYCASHCQPDKQELYAQRPVLEHVAADMHRQLHGVHAQKQLLLCKSNPNLSSVVCEGGTSSLLPEYRPAPDYHSVMHEVTNSACDSVPLVKQNVLNSTSSSYACAAPESGSLAAYSTPDLLVACDDSSTMIGAGPRSHKHFCLNRNNFVAAHVQTRSPPHPLHGYRPPPPYPGDRRTPPYSKSTSTSSPDLVAASSVQYIGGPSQLRGSFTDVATLGHSGGRSISRTYENLCDLDDVVTSLRQHMNTSSQPHFLHSFASVGDLDASRDGLDDEPAVYRLSSTLVTQPERRQSRVEPIYQNVVSLTQGQQEFYQIGHGAVHQKHLQETVVQAREQTANPEEEARTSRQKWGPARNVCPTEQISPVQDITVLGIPRTGYSLANSANLSRAECDERSPTAAVYILKSSGVNCSNPLSSSVDSTKSSPVVCSAADTSADGTALLRTSESLSALPSTTAINTVTHSSKNEEDLKSFVVECPTHLKPTNSYESEVKSKTLTGTISPRLDSSKKCDGVQSDTDKTNGSVNKSTPSSQLKTVSSVAKEPCTKSVLGSPSNASDNDTAITISGSGMSNEPLKQTRVTSGAPIAKTLSQNSSTANVSSRNPAVMSRIFASRDPRARLLQNELLSAELPAKFRGIALSKLHATFAPGPEGHHCGSEEDDPMQSRDHPVWHTWPYSDNRVMLSSAPNKKLYINASHLTASIGRSRQVFYIVHSTPPADCTEQVWRCVWEHDIRVIVLLAHCPQLLNSSISANTVRPSKASRLLSSFSKKRNKKSFQQDAASDSLPKSEFDPLRSGLCFPYWPQFDNTSLECGPYRILRRDSTQGEGYTISRLHMQQKQPGGFSSGRTVWHLHYQHGLTDTAAFIELIEQLSSIREMSQQEAGADDPGILNVNVPVLLQCPDGIEHCGALILCDVMMAGACDASSSREGTLKGTGFASRDAITDATLNPRGDGAVLDPAKILPHLRQQRANLVPTYDIFQFVYRVMIEYFGRSRLI